MKNINTFNKGEGAERLLTRLEVARYFRVSKETIRRWENLGKIEPIIINARVYRYSAASIQNIEKN
jgi:DNA-binding transcriptional MerR regulator